MLEGIVKQEHLALAPPAAGRHTQKSALSEIRIFSISSGARDEAAAPLVVGLCVDSEWVKGKEVGPFRLGLG